MPVLPLFQVDAFADRVFAGNPAAVCPLEAWLDDDTLQSIAAENNLSETAFFVPEGEGFRLRWFTPISEVDLCGHATLATGHVLFEHLGLVRSELRFLSKSGRLTVTREPDGRITLDFPSRPPAPVDQTQAIAVAEALRVEPVLVLGSARDYMVLLEHEGQLRDLKPDFAAVARLDRLGTMVTAPADADNLDFVSRFFAPSEAIDEDPVTGSAHCTLVPWWAEHLAKIDLEAAQLSKRGGRLWCRLRGARVLISGHAVTYLEGRITV